MNKGKISSIQFASFFLFIILSFYHCIGFSLVNQLSSVNSYLSIFMAYIIGLFVLWLFFVIFHFRPKENIFEKNTFLFGNLVGKIINSSIQIIFLIIAVFMLCSISDFVISIYFVQTSYSIFMFLFLVLIIFFVRKGLPSMAASSIIFLILFSFFSCLGFIGEISYFKFDYLRPFLYQGFYPVIMASILLVFCVVVPIFLFLIIKKSEVRSDKNINKKIFLFYTISFFFIFLDNILTVGTISIYLVNIYRYPMHIALEQISLFHFVDRIENFISMKWILSYFASLSFIVYHLRQQNRFQKNYFKDLFVMIILFVLSIFLFKSYSFMVNFILPYLCFILFFIYFVIVIMILIRRF